jgi:outer membrane protein assembly factor BamB
MAQHHRRKQPRLFPGIGRSGAGQTVTASRSKLTWRGSGHKRGRPFSLPSVTLSLAGLRRPWLASAFTFPANKKKSLSIAAFDIDSRRQLWRTVCGGGGGFPTFPAQAEKQKQIGNTEIGSTGGGANATLVVEGNRLYIMGPQGDVAALDTESGKILWSKNLVREFHSNLQLGHYGYSEAPLIDGEQMIITPGIPDCLMVAIHKESGQILWQAKYPPFGDKGEDKTAYSSCVVSEAGKIRQYVNLTGRGLVGVAAADGKFLIILLFHDSGVISPRLTFIFRMPGVGCDST